MCIGIMGTEMTDLDLHFIMYLWLLILMKMSIVMLCKNTRVIVIVAMLVQLSEDMLAWWCWATQNSTINLMLKIWWQRCGFYAFGTGLTFKHHVQNYLIEGCMLDLLVGLEAEKVSLLLASGQHWWKRSAVQFESFYASYRLFKSNLWKSLWCFDHSLKWFFLSLTYYR